MANHAVQILRWQATVILTLFFSAVAGAAALGWWYARDSPPHQGPIVLLTVDGLPHGTLDPAALDTTTVESSPQSDAAQEPVSALQGLATDSVVFERAYTHSPHLLPASASLLAGRLPFEHGVRDDGGFVLPGEIRTLAELLRNRGFATGAAVSSQLLGRESGIDQGFSFFQAPAPDDPLARIDALATPDAPAPGEAPDVLDAAEAWARAQENQRYFLMLQVSADEADRAIALVTELLGERGSYDRSTIVVVGSRGRAGMQAALDEPTLLVPMLVKQPNNEHAGLRVNALVQHVDLLPTLLDLVRAPIPGDLRGRSLKPLLTDEDGRITPQPVYAESLSAFYRFGGYPLFALTVNGLRYVQGAADSLVRLDEPPGPETAAPGFDEGREDTDIEPLRATLDRLLAQDVPHPARPLPSREVERLAATGYLQGLPAGPEVEPPDHLSLDEQERLLDAHQAAAQLLGARRYAAAVRSLQALARSHPSMTDLLYQIGAVALHGDRTQDALASLRAAAARRPDSPEIASLLALALLRSNRIDEAHLEVDRAVALAADLELHRVAAAQMLAARLAVARGDYEAALAHATAVEHVDPSVPMRTFVDALRLAKDNDPGAAAAFDRAVRHIRQHEAAALHGLHLGLAEALVAEGNVTGAEAAFREEILAFPASIEAYTGLAALYHADGRPEAAGAAVRVLLDQAPTRAAYMAAAGTWNALGERARAEAVRLEARERFRGDPAQAPRPRDRSQ
jgi:arylsulfatase A-like enzyme/tetratricopeptide (TPR) repeat protein